jgi:acyl-coenzyme A synthetase/AMP-(fatty) acid ligase
MQASLPLTSTGKLQRRQLKQTALELVVAGGGQSHG